MNLTLFGLLLGALFAMPDPASSASLLGSSWLMTRVGDLKVSSLSVPLTFAKDRIYGSDGCNRIQVPVVHEDDGKLRFNLERSTTTLMGCMGEADTVSRAFKIVLQDTQAYEIKGDQLILKNTQGEILAVYAPQAKALAGTHWQLHGVNNGKEAIYSSGAVSQLSMRFLPSGEVKGLLGCVPFAGRYTADEATGAATLSALKLEKAGQATCQNKAEVKAAQDHFLASAKRVVSYRREGKTLDMRSADGAAQLTAFLQDE